MTDYALLVTATRDAANGPLPADAETRRHLHRCADAIEKLAADLEDAQIEVRNYQNAGALPAGGLREALEAAAEQFAEICRGTEPKAGNGDSWAYGIANKAHEAARATLSALAPAAGRENKLYLFLAILQAAGGQCSGNDEPYNWINYFCDDAEPLDTFNQASKGKLTRVTHDSDTDNSEVYLTDAGRKYLAAGPKFPPQEEWPTHSGATVGAVALVEGLKAYPTLNEDDPNGGKREAFIQGFERASEFATPPAAGDRAAVISDDALWAMQSELHANIPDDQRPMSWSDFSPEQIERLRRAANVLIGATLPRADEKAAP